MRLDQPPRHPGEACPGPGQNNGNAAPARKTSPGAKATRLNSYRAAAHNGARRMLSARRLWRQRDLPPVTAPVAPLKTPISRQFRADLAPMWTARRTTQA
ncbi:hypothetical protein SAMN05192539_1012151 [Paraburkholderia diazotrophica]|uniref:Uncharacterized protein n=1 Tax=Paraburkholderia diazotrophica TaxID=667676 RepID=A0A1H6ZGG0_9BURK|nr:hypothetical protein SAMN05192539_1012151 [Paraburkholderia diazotrophica]